MSYRRGFLTFMTSPPITLAVVAPTTEEEKAKGLQGFQLDEHGAMVFFYPSPRIIDMHMGTVSYPIAMLWLNAGEVTAVAMVAPGVAGTFRGKGYAVVEVHAGLAQRARILPGTPYTFVPP